MNEFEDPLRLRILKRLSAGLATIKPDDGYRNDLRGTEEVPNRVFRGRILYGDGDPLPMLSIMEIPLQPDSHPAQPDGTIRECEWELTIQGFVEDDPENPTDPAHYLAADTIRKLAVEKKANRDFDLFGMGDDVTDLVIGQPVVRPPDEISAKAYFYLPITLHLAEDLEHPYGKITL